MTARVGEQHEREDDRHLDAGVAAVRRAIFVPCHQSVSCSEASSRAEELAVVLGDHDGDWSRRLVAAPAMAASQMMTVVMLMSPRSGRRAAS
ncbi:hypothetical protein [Streptomyces sp. TLI_185]|uniref:hypothetical protein n=1 Tax=Streptomyces sp. TLI_185 TaxID=2485151 RepID=UPI0021A489C6|nr:hypothetical protein [Streptomyces sp. TLI_185]